MRTPRSKISHVAEILGGPVEYDHTPGYYAILIADPDGIKLELLHRPGFWEHAAR